MAVIHPEHAALIELMLLAGKHVLVEKPAVTRVADWDRLVRLAAGRGLLLMEAMKVMCFPAMRELLGRLAALPAPTGCGPPLVRCRRGTASCLTRRWPAAPPGMWGLPALALFRSLSPARAGGG